MGKAWDAFKTGRSAKYSRGGELITPEQVAERRGKGGAGPSYVQRPAIRCITCGKQAWSGSPCKCEKPEWREDNSPLHAFQAWCEAWGREALRVTKPGGYLLAFGGTRTHHRLVCGLEDAGWIIRDELTWVYASGFPKGKANLKPAHEPIVLARKPGPLRPLNIEETRIGTDGQEVHKTAASGTLGRHGIYGAANEVLNKKQVARAEEGLNPRYDPSGRWPSNLLLSDPELFDEPNPYVVGSGATSQATPPGTKRPGPRFSGGTYANGEIGGEQTEYGYGDIGGYSRFFRVPAPGPDLRQLREDGGGSGGTDDPQHPHRSGEYPSTFLIPKADRADREPVLRGQLEQRGQSSAEFGGEAGRPGRSLRDGEWVNTETPRKTRTNTHATVKPTNLMRHLVRLVTPSGGTVLDPFLGSGSTAIACELEGFPWIGIEKEPEYVAIAEARLNGTQRGLGLDVGAPTKTPPKTHPDLSKHQPKRRAPGENYTGGWAGTDEEPAA